MTTRSTRKTPVPSAAELHAAEVARTQSEAAAAAAALAEARRLHADAHATVDGLLVAARAGEPVTDELVRAEAHARVTALAVEGAQERHRKALGSVVSDDVQLAELLAPIFREVTGLPVQMQSHTATDDAQVPGVLIVQTRPTELDGLGQLSGRVRVIVSREKIHRSLDESALSDALECLGGACTITNTGSEAVGDGVHHDSYLLQLAGVLPALPVLSDAELVEGPSELVRELVHRIGSATSETVAGGPLTGLDTGRRVGVNAEATAKVLNEKQAGGERRVTLSVSVTASPARSDSLWRDLSTIGDLLEATARGLVDAGVPGLGRIESVTSTGGHVLPDAARMRAGSRDAVVYSGGGGSYVTCDALRVDLRVVAVSAIAQVPTSRLPDADALDDDGTDAASSRDIRDREPAHPGRL